MPDPKTATAPKPPTVEKLARTCLGCGCLVDESTAGCLACYERHCMRLKRARARARQAGGAEAGDAA